MLEGTSADADFPGGYADLATFRTDIPEYFEESIQPVARRVSVQPKGRPSFYTEVKLAKLPRIGLFTVRCSAMRVLTAEPLGFLSLTIPLAQSFTVVERKKRELFAPGTGHLASYDLPFDLNTADGTRVLVANFDLSLINAYKAKLAGGETSGEFVVCPRLSMTSPRGASFWRYLSFVWSEMDRGSAPLRSPIVAREMEDSLLAMLLYASERNAPDLRSLRVAENNSSYVRQAEEYILAHLCEAISIGDIAEAVGVNVRTLSRGFKKRHGLGPIAFLKERRLESAQRALLAADPRLSSVTEIAMRHGFGHLGQFSQDYKRAFQELPSETLRR